ncbi:MAG: hypothetical protein JSR36_08315 [Proteobacteria bacterium]|nr:hypothetical protein [Pseudomonadota bacterium]
MTGPAAGAGANRRRPGGAVAFWKAALVDLTWRSVLTAEALGLVVNVLRFLDGWGPTHNVIARTVFTTLAPLLLVVAALGAAEAVRRGAAPVRAYLAALVAAACASAGLQFLLRQVLGIHPPAGGVTSAVVKEWVWFGADIQTVILLGGIGFIAFYNRRSVERILQNVRSAELKRVRLENELIESRLATAQAQVDPRTLFESLARIRNLYASSSPDADRALEDLIQSLRTRRVASGAVASADGLAP